MLCDSKSNFIEFTLDFQRNYNISILKKREKDKRQNVSREFTTDIFVVKY